MMKKMTMMIVAVVAAVVPLKAETETIGGVEWGFQIFNGEAVIVSPGMESSCGNIPGLKGDVVIPSVLGGCPVTGIASGVLWGATDTTSIVIPDTIVSVGGGAVAYAPFFYSGITNVTIGSGVTSLDPFVGCNKLATITLSAGNAAFAVKDGVLYDKALKRLVCYPAGMAKESFSVPAGVEEIGKGAFAFDCWLKNVTVPNSVTQISSYAFWASSCSAIIFEGNAPVADEDVFHNLSGECTIRVARESSGWGVPIPGTWNGVRIVYVGEPDPEPLPESDAPCAGILDAAFSTMQVVGGALYNKDKALVGTMQVKVGKINARKQTVKVSATASVMLDGKVKKVTATAANLTLSEAGTLSGTLVFKAPLGEMAFAMDADGRFTMDSALYRVEAATIGGDWLPSKATATVEMGDLSMFAGMVLADFLPTNETAGVKGGKWTFAKAAGVKWARPKKGAALPDIYDEVSGKGLIIDDAKGKTNLSGLKLTYTPKKGTFKGSFKVYALEGAGKSTKLKKYTFNVTGVVVDGAGYGVATCKKPSVSWSVTVE